MDWWTFPCVCKTVSLCLPACLPACLPLPPVRLLFDGVLVQARAKAAEEELEKAATRFKALKSSTSGQTRAPPCSRHRAAH